MTSTNEFLGGLPGDDGTIDLDDDDDTELSPGGVGYALALTTVADPLARHVFAEYQDACSPPFKFDFQPLVADIARRRAEAEAGQGEAALAHAELLERDRVELERRVLDYNAAAVPFVRLFFTLVARFDAMRVNVGVNDPAAMHQALRDNLVMANQQLGPDASAFPAELVTEPALVEVIAAAMSGATALMLRRIDYERSTMVAYKSVVAALEAAADDDEREPHQETKASFEKLAVAVRNGVHALLSGLFELPFATDTELFAADDVDASLAELAELVAAIDGGAGASVNALREALGEHVGQLRQLQQGLHERRACYLAFGQSVDARAAGEEIAERYATVFVLVAQAREVCAFAVALESAWGDAEGFAAWVAELEAHRQVAPPEGLEALEVGEDEAALLAAWVDIIARLKQNLATVIEPYQAVEEAAARLGNAPEAHAY